MKITEYPSVSEVNNSTVFIIDGDNGTKKITADDLRYALFNDIPEMHRNIFRGKPLGSSFTTEQKTAVQNGTFDDLWIGDYWTINGIDYVIADMDYFYGKGIHDSVTQGFQTHHLVIVPRNQMYKDKYDDSMENYNGSYIRTSGLNNAKTTITNAFSSNIISFPDLLINSIGDSSVSRSSIWVYNCTVELLSEYMVFGTLYLSVMNGALTLFNSSSAIISNMNCDQIAIFRLCPSFIKSRHSTDSTSTSSWWLRDNGYSGRASMVGANGNSSVTINISKTAGVRPFFCIG
jgi:hypothetical protein